MSLLSRLGQRLGSIAQTTASPLLGGERVDFAAELPAGDLGPLLRLKVQVVSEPHGNGERLRLRAHVQTNLASVLRPALAAAPAAGSRERALSPVQKAGRLAGRSLSRMLAQPLVQRLTEPLLQHDLNTWVELQASTASLDAGAYALLPKSPKLEALGIRPTRKNGPVAETWAGEAPGGYAQVSLLQLDKQDLPAGLAALLGDQPFSLAAAVVNTVDRKA